MKLKLSILFGSAAVFTLAGCASHPLTVSAVGPAPAGAEHASSRGYLQVFTDVERHEIGDSTYYFPHTSYDLLTDSGRHFKLVMNHLGDMDEKPTVVDIPPGKYKVVAQSANCGPVTVPVLVTDGHLTVLHLDGDWKPPVNTPTNQLVYLPDGEPIGWQTAQN